VKYFNENKQIWGGTVKEKLQNLSEMYERSFTFAHAQTGHG
jgi:hypothetical protein